MMDPATVPSRAEGASLAVRGFRQVFVDERDGPLPAMLLALTVVAGILDATTIVRLGGVFVATMTGNLVFIGLAAAGAKGFALAPSAWALGGFVLGVLVGGRVCRAARSHRGLALRNVLAIKLWLAGAVTLIAILNGSQFATGTRNLMIVLLSISMGAQLATIRYLRVPDLLTVVVTMAITGALTERGGGWSDPKWLRRALSVVAFSVGALAGGLIVLGPGVAAALASGLGILVAVAVAAHVMSRTRTRLRGLREAAIFGGGRLTASLPFTG